MLSRNQRRSCRTASVRSPSMTISLSGSIKCPTSPPHCRRKSLLPVDLPKSSDHIKDTSSPSTVRLSVSRPSARRSADQGADGLLVACNDSFLNDSELVHPIHQCRSRQAEAQSGAVSSGYDAIRLVEDAENVAALRIRKCLFRCSLCVRPPSHLLRPSSPPLPPL